MKKAIYAFSGDPITFGHIDIIKRAALVFDQLIVAIGTNPQKQYLFSEAKRAEMARRSLAALTNVEVKTFDGMLVDFAYEHDVHVIVKGVRSSKDFEYEQGLHSLGDSQRLGIDTFVLFARPELAHISSGAVKDIQKEQGLIQDYVPPYVKQCIEAKLSGQYIVGLTGEIGSGKSYVGEQLATLGGRLGVEVHNIELDHLSWQIQSDLQEEKYALVRRQIAAAFGPTVINADGSIKRKALGEIVFADQDKLAQLNEIMATPILVRLRKELKNKRGLIILNAALLVEAEMSRLANYNMILLTVDPEVQQERLLARGLNAQQIERRLASQYDLAHKKAALEQAIEVNKQGKLWMVENQNNSQAAIKDLFNDLCAYFKISTQ